jgi:hypothetical protein
MQELLSKYYKPALYTIGGFILLYALIWIFTRQPQMPAEYKAAIDSLTKANAVLAEHQAKLDSTINVYEAEVQKVDYEINHIKEKTTVVKEYHHEVIQQVDHYDATQVDSFFKTRYSY